MNDQTLLHRQVHPSLVQNKIVSSDAFLEKSNVQSTLFMPKPNDKDKLSVYNGDKFTPESSYNHYVQNLESFGTLSVNVKECLSVESLSVAEDNDPFDGHAYIDFAEVTSKSQKKIKAGKLRDYAMERGWRHLPK